MPPSREACRDVAGGAEPQSDVVVIVGVDRKGRRAVVMGRVPGISVNASEAVAVTKLIAMAIRGASGHKRARSIMWAAPFIVPVPISIPFQLMIPPRHPLTATRSHSSPAAAHNRLARGRPFAGYRLAHGRLAEREPTVTANSSAPACTTTSTVILIVVITSSTAVLHVVRARRWPERGAGRSPHGRRSAGGRSAPLFDFFLDSCPNGSILRGVFQISGRSNGGTGFGADNRGNKVAGAVGATGRSVVVVLAGYLADDSIVDSGVKCGVGRVHDCTQGHGCIVAGRDRFTSRA